MKHLKNFVFVIMLLSTCLCLIAGHDGEGSEVTVLPVANVELDSGGIYFFPTVEYQRLLLTVATPKGSVAKRIYNTGEQVYMSLQEMCEDCPSGSYTYELRVIPPGEPLPELREEGLPLKTLAQTGMFSTQRGAIITALPAKAIAAQTKSGNDISRPKDYLIYDDLIVTGSFCVGFDCQNGETFNFDTIILKEHNLRIYFNDTSYVASYPTNSWRISINDSTNGGGSYFAVDDVDDGTRPFKIEAGAPSNSLYVEDYGRVGLGTSTPVLELHIKDSDTPSVRLEQDSSGGWPAQTFDIAGNESNFFIRDATNGSKLPFRIQPGTPTSTLTLRQDGKVGIGTWSPAYTLEVETTGTGAQMVAERTDGATMEFSASGSYGIAGTKTNHPVRLRVNDTMIMQLNGSGDYIEMIGGGTYNGTWNPSSSRELKENIKNLSLGDAQEAFHLLNPVTYNYKVDKKENRVGFIAEDVPELVALEGRKSLGTVDIVAVLTKVVQQQEKTIEKLNRRLAEVEKKLEKN